MNVFQEHCSKLVRVIYHAAAYYVKEKHDRFRL